MYMNTINFEELENNISHNNMENTITDLSQQPMDYYFKINPTTRMPTISEEEFKKRATELGFRGYAMRNGEYTKTYKKYFNKIYKEKNDMKTNPIKNNKITKVAKNKEEYINQVDKFLLDKQPITVKLDSSNKLKTLLSKALQSSTKRILLTIKTKQGKIKGYTLNPETARRLQDIVIYDKDTMVEESDEEIKSFINADIIESVELSIPTLPNKKSGAFFKYKHIIDNLDLTDLQIYNVNQSINPNSYCCFLQALISGGLSQVKINTAKSLIISRHIPTCKINQLCIDLQIHITIKSPSHNNKLIHYPTEKNELCKIIRTQTPINLGLIDEHYFHIKQVPITSYAITHYEDIKHIKDFHKIYKKNSSGVYKKCNDRFIDSYNCIKLLLENKNKLLNSISLSDEDIYSSNMYDKFTEIKSLEYEDINIKPTEFKMKEDKDNHVNIFADFETTTDYDKHIPYVLHIRNTELKINKSFIGEDCAYKGLQYLSKLGSNIRLIFHNAGYDIRFLYKHISCFSCIERGKFLLRAYGRFYYRKDKFIHLQIQDSYALIPEPLRKFNSMFDLEVYKEILPYGLYTRENVEKGYIELDECIEEVKKQFVKNNIGKEINIEEQNKFVKDFIINVNKWNCLDNNKVDIIRYSKEYCEMDVIVLEQGYNKFRQYVKDITYSCNQEDLDDELTITDEKYIDIDNYVSVASFSLDYMVMNGVFDNINQFSGVIREFINKCMYGGRTMVSKNEIYASNVNIDYNDPNNKLSKKHNGIFNQVLADFDAVSLYPSAMEQLEGFLCGVPKIIENTDYDNIKNYDGYFVEILITEVNKQYNFPLMNKKNEEGIREWTNDMVNETFYCDKTTLEELIKYHKIKFQIIRGYYFNEGRNYKLKTTIQHLFNTRLKAKAEKNPIEKIYKLIMNSCYGKTLLKPFDTKTEYISHSKYKDYISKNYNWIKDTEYIEEKNEWKITSFNPINNHYNMVHCGVEVLSTSKKIMNSVMCLAEDLNIDMYYTDTDSIAIDNSKLPLLEEEYEKINNKKLCGNNMSQFNTDFSSDIIINNIMDKINAKNNTKLKFKELPKEEQEKYENSILSKRSVFLGKKCYIHELYSEYSDVVDYHIRLKRIPNPSILHYCKKNTITPYELYLELYNEETIDFDMTCDNLNVVFKFHKNMIIETLYKGDKDTSIKVQFK